VSQMKMKMMMKTLMMILSHQSLVTPVYPCWKTVAQVESWIVLEV